MKNRLIVRSRMSEEKARRMIYLFAADFNAQATALAVPLDHKTVKLHFLKIRRKITENLRKQNTELLKSFEIKSEMLATHQISTGEPSSYISESRISLIEHRKGNENQIYADVLTAPDETKLREISEHLQSIVRKNKSILRVIFTDLDFNLDGALNSLEAFFHNTLCIEDFISFIKNRNRAFYGLDKTTFIFHLKESEWRYNRLGIIPRIYFARRILDRSKNAKIIIANSCVKQTKFLPLFEGDYFSELFKDQAEVTEAFGRMNDELLQIIEAVPL